MRLPKGFGKNYFTLAAIQATVSQNRLQATSVRIQKRHLESSCAEDEDACELEDPLLEEQELFQLLQPKAGHCSCFFKHLTLTSLRDNADAHLFVSTPLFTNSTVSPPY